MGGERASTTRRREAGLICSLSASPIPTPPPPRTRRGPGARERKCERCEPRPIRITLNLQGYLTPRCDLSATFHCYELRAAIGPWLLLDSPRQLDVILRWGRTPLPEVRECYDDLKRWSRTSTTLYLTERDRQGLIARGRGCSWDGYQLTKLRAAGRMPERAKFRNFPD